MRRLHEIAGSLDRVPFPLASVIAKTKGLSLLDAPKVDSDKMTSEVCVCTDIVDYQQEVILASGVDTANHVNNPQVWFEHGEDPMFTLTLALAEDENGNYTLTKPDDFSIYSVSHFAKSAEEFPIVYQLFGLIDKGVLRATSIHVQPNPGGISTYHDRESGGKYNVTEDSHLIEYSHCKVGVNPEALKKALRFDSKYKPLVSEELKRAVELQANHASDLIRTNQIGGHALLPAVKKSLAAMVRTGSSITLLTGDPQDTKAMPSNTQKKSITGKELARLSKSDLEEIITTDSLEDYTVASQARLKSMFKKVMEDFAQEEEKKSKEAESESEESGDESEAKPAYHSDNTDGKGKGSDESSDDESDEEPEDSDDESEEDEKSIKKNANGDGMKLGQSVLTEAYDAMNYLSESIEKAMGPVENPDVAEGMGEIMGQVRGMIEAMDGLHAKAYGKPFTTKEAEEKSMNEEEESLKSQLKSFLSQRGKQTENYRIIGHAARLREYGQRRDVPASVRKSLLNLSSGLESIQSSAQTVQVNTISRDEFNAIVKQRDEAIQSQKKAISQRDMLLDRLEKLTAEALPAS